MKKILITGSSGMLGANAVKILQKKYNIYSTSSSDFNNNPAKKFKKFNLKEHNYSELKKWVKNPDIIIHTAAITNIESCEINKKKAMLINGESVKKLITTFSKSKILFISTDAVFGPNTHFANEKTKTKPLTVYGKSKKLGEDYLLDLNTNGSIIRTTIVGKNINQKKTSFTEWIINQIKHNKKIDLYTDRFFTPITIWDLIKELEWVMQNTTPKIMHISGDDIINKYNFGYRLISKLKLNTKMIIKKEYRNTKINIRKNLDQTLDSTLYQKLSNHKLPKINNTIDKLAKYFT